MLAVTALLTIVVGLVVAFLFLRKGKDKSKADASAKHVDVVADASAAGDDKSAKPTIRILYGTQTGTAERFSKQLCNNLRGRYTDQVAVEVIDIENYQAPVRMAKEKLVLFLMATYGDGEPTDNAAEFYNWLLGAASDVDVAQPALPLEGVAYGVFGLGNKQYEHFCAVGKKVHKSMKDLGARPIVDRGEGDDDDCIDDDFDRWCEALVRALEAHADILGQHLGDTGAAPADAPVEQYEVTIHAAPAAEATPYAPGGSGADHHHPFLATVSAVRQLHGSASDRSCVHVELDVAGAAATYQHGDHVAVFPRNSPETVRRAAELLGVAPGTVFSLAKPAGGGSSSMLPDPFPGPLALETALACFTDLLASPHKDALAALAAVATDVGEAATLRKLASHTGKQDYGEYIQKQQRSLLEVLGDFPSARPSLGLFFGAIAPRLQPRYYSISSSPRAHPTAVHVTCAVVRDRMPTGRLHEGVASTWLERTRPGDAVPVFLRQSTFRLPADPRTPVVMVGPGTGLAPFRGFLQERAALAAEGQQLGEAHLFFGCRRREQDYIYEEELRAFVASGALTGLHVAFSREGATKDYVQHHVERLGAQVWRLLAQEGGHVYVCGDAKHMAKDVHRALLGLWQAHGGLAGTQAEGALKRLQDEGRYLRDVW